jgi:hypothetical protein
VKDTSEPFELSDEAVKLCKEIIEQLTKAEVVQQANRNMDEEID